ncbi:gluconokinase-like [Leptopilina boulardi]|uniref:gluconokinase-like n=1 Tax=Leptopilina boulardi TaxID=63433 RepID=UPI0021F5368A|nr:gluconokinase-like [Leptopilina boulardi]XP_051157567.1 gluconokinase-like [Leptopilina boulardi]XP_051157568.1 gluconokinase-like [Leptopilina boulardi]XP_051157570.1 gluconokinase-like [Leptopilina boulardi]XP_051157571.1 gluconokinase-like [Leptopilina boulardi]
MTTLKPPLIIVMGVSASGKTTIGGLLAKKLNVEFLDGDNFHSAKSVEKMAKGIPLNDDDRQQWLEEISMKISNKSRENKGLVIACSALKLSYRNIIRSSNYIDDDKEIIFVYIKGTMELFKKRIEHREGHFMPVSLLQSQFDTLEEPRDNEVTNEKKSSRVIEVSAELNPDEIIEEIVKQLLRLTLIVPCSDDFISTNKKTYKL